MNRNKTPIIYYHSIAPAKHTSWSKKHLTLELKYFEEHLKYFSKNGYRFIKLIDVIGEIKDSDMHQNVKKVCLTFDDGYLDNFIYVYPLLKKYKAKATIFINPVFIDKRNIVRKTLEDYWNSRATLEEINKWGFLSWDEMRVMEASGSVDIQSHTMTHTKYFVSDKLTGFHHPGSDCVYAVGNLFPDRLPYYIDDEAFEKLIPFGYPFFEQKSSIIAHKVSINQSFSHSIIQSLKNVDWNRKQSSAEIYNRIKSLYEDAKENNSIIEAVETEVEYKKRVHFELKESKDIIEKELNKKVEICCWPHGDNSELAHKTALEMGYTATTTGKNNYGNSSIYNKSRIPPRIGLSKSKNSRFLTKLKVHYKIRTAEENFPYQVISQIYNKIRYGI